MSLVKDPLAGSTPLHTCIDITAILSDGLIVAVHNAPSTRCWFGQSPRISDHPRAQGACLVPVMLQHPPCETHNYRRRKAGIPVTAR